MSTRIERFNEKWKLSIAHSYKGEACWEWAASVNSDGYGNFWNGEKLTKAHRWSYEYFCESIPEGLELDHLCKNRSCVQPSHLEAVTHAINIARGDYSNNGGASKRNCPQGHEYDGENTYVDPIGYRHCRICKRETQRLRRAN